ncbi:MAG: ubiquinone/menaquinone biosynthesis methyltransferase [Cyanobacteria bacterium SIG29]|nr:ubiquinone/menaquinone biosynthesis methyltransferase [Cyanobacteria bacterium SIG29]
MNIKNLFDNLANKYDFMNNIISLGTHKFIKRLAIKELNIKPNSKVLDLCCGTGDLGSIIKEIEPTCDVIGVDFSENMLEIARKRNPKNTYWNLDATNLPFEKNSFDYIVMGFGLRNIVQKNKSLEEIHRILKTNGEFLHIDFGKHNTISKLHDNLIIFLAKIFYKNTKPYKYLVLSKRNFLEPIELIELFKFNKFECKTHKELIFKTISFQIIKKAN